ncbi:MAG: uncharacterized protein JWP95_1123 [Actinotalea sp.]|nr:uncharacterized protein [Actinotalea sp.]
MLTENQIHQIAGGTVYDSDGDKIGRAGQVFLDDQTGQPEWVSVNTGFFGTSESFVPLRDATMDGDAVRVRYTKEIVKGAPTIDADQHLSGEDEQRLYEYYGLGYEGYSADATTGTYAETDTYTGTGTTAQTGTGFDRTEQDDAMTVSEERLNVGTERREAGRARLRKYVVTDTETVTVPVTREEVRIEREPITEGNIDRALDGPEISEAEHEVILTEERPVIAKETVPVERVRLEKETVVDQQTVTEDVRKERVETEGVETTGYSGTARRDDERL